MDNLPKDQFIAEALRLQGHPAHRTAVDVREHAHAGMKWGKHILCHAATLEKLAAAEAVIEEKDRIIREQAASVRRWRRNWHDAQTILQTAVGAVEKAHKQFEFYAQEHDAKAEAAKKAHDDACYWGNVAEQKATKAEWAKRAKQAETNHDFASMLAGALAAIREGGSHGQG